MTCALCLEQRPSHLGASRTCAGCRAAVFVCFLCGDGKSEGSVRFSHGCEGQLQLGGV